MCQGGLLCTNHVCDDFLSSSGLLYGVFYSPFPHVSDECEFNRWQIEVKKLERRWVSSNFIEKSGNAGLCCWQDFSDDQRTRTGESGETRPKQGEGRFLIDWKCASEKNKHSKCMRMAKLFISDSSDILIRTKNQLKRHDNWSNQVNNFFPNVLLIVMELKTRPLDLFWSTVRKPEIT